MVKYYRQVAFKLAHYDVYKIYVQPLYSIIYITFVHFNVIGRDTKSSSRQQHLEKFLLKYITVSGSLKMK